jgi:hypothetical protein
MKQAPPYYSQVWQGYYSLFASKSASFVFIRCHPNSSTEDVLCFYW